MAISATLAKFWMGMVCEDDARTMPAPERVGGITALVGLIGGTGWHVVHTGAFAAAEMQGFGIAVATIIGSMGGVIMGKAHFGADTVKAAPPQPKDGD